MVRNQILVVADDLDVCHTIETHMQDKGDDVHCIVSVSEALDSITKVDYCLAIVSNQLPGISGIEMLRIMRLTQHFPIMVLAAPLSPDEKVALFQAGADAIMESPFNIDICAAQAEALIQLYTSPDIEHTHRMERQISFGTSLIIIPHFRQVFAGGKPVSLTRKEFDLLLCFARHQRQVLSREQLYLYVWGESFATGGDETVKSHIRTLRKKIETQGRTLIHNVWGVGYQFIPPEE